MKLKQKLYIFLIAILANLILYSAVYPQARKSLKQKWNLVSQKLQFARELQSTFSNRASIEILNEAEHKLTQARRLIQIRRRMLANRSMNDAEKLINRAIKELLREPLRIRREKLDEKIGHAKQLTRKSQVQEAIDLLKKGIENKRLAGKSFKANEYQRALKHFQQAEFQVQKSIDIVQSRDKSTKQKAGEEARRFAKLLDQSKSWLSNNNDETVQKNYRSAIKLSEEAAGELNNGNYRNAIDLYHQATRLLLRTRDQAEGKTDRTAQKAYDEVSALDELIKNLQQRVKPLEDNERIQFFMSHIEQLQQDAHKALEAQDYNLVLLNTQYAKDLIERVRMKMGAGKNDLGELIRQELKQLEVDLKDIQDRLETERNNKEAQVLLTYARLAKVKAGELLNEQKYRFAKESILVANRFAFAADRLIRNQQIDEISSESVLNKILAAEQDVSNLQSKAAGLRRPDARIYFDHARKMLNLARANLNRNFLYAADECIEASRNAIDKLNTIIK